MGYNEDIAQLAQFKVFFYWGYQHFGDNFLEMQLMDVTDIANPFSRHKVMEEYERNHSRRLIPFMGSEVEDKHSANMRGEENDTLDTYEEFMLRLMIGYSSNGLALIRKYLTEVKGEAIAQPKEKKIEAEAAIEPVEEEAPPKPKAVVISFDQIKNRRNRK